MTLLIILTFFISMQIIGPQPNLIKHQEVQKISLDTVLIQTIGDNKKDPNYPAIVTGVVGIITVLVNLGIGLLATYIATKNINKQLATSKQIADLQFNSQILVNLEKDWAKNVRDNLATVLYQARFIWQADGNVNDSNSVKYYQAVDEMASSYSRLTLFLDKNEKHALTLMQKALNVKEMASDATGEYNKQQFDQGIEDAISAAHILFNSRMAVLTNQTN